MAVTATPIFAQVPRTTSTATISGTVAVFTAGANGSKIDAIGITTTTTCDVSFSFDNANAAPIGKVNVPTNSGTNNAVPTVDVLRSSQMTWLSFDAFGNKCLYLSAAAVLYATSTVTTGVVTVQGADF